MTSLKAHLHMEISAIPQTLHNFRLPGKRVTRYSVPTRSHVKQQGTAMVMLQALIQLDSLTLDFSEC